MKFNTGLLRKESLTERSLPVSLAHRVQAFTLSGMSLRRTAGGWIVDHPRECIRFLCTVICVVTPAWNSQYEEWRIVFSSANGRHYLNVCSGWVIPKGGAPPWGHRRKPVTCPPGSSSSWTEPSPRLPVTATIRSNLGLMTCDVIESTCIKLTITINAEELVFQFILK